MRRRIIASLAYAGSRRGLGIGAVALLALACSSSDGGGGGAIAPDVSAGGAAGDASDARVVDASAEIGSDAEAFDQRVVDAREDASEEARDGGHEEHGEDTGVIDASEGGVDVAADLGVREAEAGDARAESSDSGAPGDAGMCTPRSVWAGVYGSPRHQQAEAVAMDPAGGIAVTGYFSERINFGGDDLTTTQDNDDIFLARFDAEGHHVFSKSFASVYVDVGYGVAIDRHGGVVISGYVEGPIDFGGGVLSTTEARHPNAFVAKFDAAGNYVFAKRYGGQFGGTAESVATDPDDNVVIAGAWTGRLDYDGGFATPDGVSTWAAKFDPMGNESWSKTSTTGIPRANAVAIDASGNVVISGNIVQAFDFGGGSLQPAGDNDVFLVKFGPDGRHIFSKVFGDAGVQLSYGVATDASGRIFLGGNLQGSADFGGGTLTSAGSNDVFLASFEPDGRHRWSKRFGDASTQVVWGVSADAAGNVALSGTMVGTVDFGGGPLTGQGLGDAMVARFDADGRHICSGVFGNNQQQNSLGVATNGASTAIVGSAFGAIDFGGGPLVTKAGDAYIAVLKL